MHPIVVIIWRQTIYERRFLPPRRRPVIETMLLVNAASETMNQTSTPSNLAPPWAYTTDSAVTTGMKTLTRSMFAIVATTRDLKSKCYDHGLANMNFALVSGDSCLKTMLYSKRFKSSLEVKILKQNWRKSTGPNSISRGTVWISLTPYSIKKRSCLRVEFWRFILREIFQRRLPSRLVILLRRIMNLR